VEEELVPSSAKRLLDRASYALRLSPAPRREPVSPLRLAAERYKTAASRQHLDAVLARFHQRWIIEPETFDEEEMYDLAESAEAAVNEIVLLHPERKHELSRLQALIEQFYLDQHKKFWELFRHELLRVLPDLDDPLVVAESSTEGPPFLADESAAFDHEEKGF
jgi:hypothetical protein